MTTAFPFYMFWRCEAVKQNVQNENGMEVSPEDKLRKLTGYALSSKQSAGLCTDCALGKTICKKRNIAPRKHDAQKWTTILRFER